MQKSIIFRTDASIRIGTGHVFRCLTLATKLKYFFKIYFICREINGNLIHFLQRKGFDVYVLPKSNFRSVDFQENVECLEHSEWLEERWDTDANLTASILKNIKDVEWLIVDHYSIDYKWESAIKKFSSKLMVIDDLNDRKHNCHLLLDSNYSKTPKEYAKLTPEDCKLLIGSDYTIIRDEFTKLREDSLKRRITPQLKRILIFMGGADKKNVTSKILRGLSGFYLPPNIKIDVIVGISSPWYEDIRGLASTLPCEINILTTVENLADFFLIADLAILAAGGTFWESCYMGLPSILISTAENQSKLFSYISSLNLPVLLDNDDAFTIKLNSYLKKMLINNGLLKFITNDIQHIIRGDGIDLIVNEICLLS